VEKESFIRKMNAKHLVMLSLDGVIGTGIFLSSSYLIQMAGQWEQSLPTLWGLAL
jgi:L-asparagine transporter-like permease